MKELNGIVSVVAAAFCLATSMPGALGAEANLDVYANSKYLWRGQMLNDEPVVQPGLTATASNGLSFNVWGNYNLTDARSETTDRKFDEVDLTASYAVPIEDLNLEVGIMQYLFPHQGSVQASTAANGSTIPALKFPDTREVYVSAGLNSILKPTAKVYYDFDQVEGFYGVASISHGIRLTESMTTDLTLSLGAADSDYNSYYFGVNEDALNDGDATLSLSYELNKAWSFGGYVQYARLLDGRIREAANTASGYFNHDDMVVCGVHAKYDF